MKYASRPAIAAWMAALSLTTGTFAHAFAPKVLHTEPSQFSPVVVYEAYGERCMTFGSLAASGRQTCYALNDPNRMVFNYTRMMMAALFVNPAPQRILIVGLGGGTLPSALASLLPQAEIDVVEIDPAVVRVAREYFGFAPSARLRVHQLDGRALVEQMMRAQRQFDLIMLDAFDFNYIPRHLMTQEFLEQVKSILAPGGVLAANTFASSDLYECESATYAVVFGQYLNLTANNRIIFAVNGKLPDASQRAQNAARWCPALARYGLNSDHKLALFGNMPFWPQTTEILKD